MNCPNCGNTVNFSDALCEACGFHLSGKKAIRLNSILPNETIKKKKTIKLHIYNT